MSKILFILVLLFAVFKLFNYQGEVILGPGVMAESSPIQTAIADPKWIEFEEYILKEQASFAVTAKVLAREDYSSGRESDLSPIDLALGWGRMSDETVLNQIEISQSGRFYYWRVQSFPIPRKEIETHSANMHFIPANDQVRDALKDVRKGDLVRFSGSLVNVTSKDGTWYWNSSLTRSDTGAGACELIWVEDFEVITAL